MLQSVNAFMTELVGLLWGIPLVMLLVGGGLYFVIISRFISYRLLGHSLALLTRKPDDDPGQLSHFQALSTALSGTLGMGNVSGVALAIGIGGPGAVLWMWVSALVGITTKFYTCTLAIMFRGYDSQGKLQGGPMYVIREGLSSSWRPLAYFFALAGLIGTMPVFQINQLVQIIRGQLAIPAGLTSADAHFGFDLIVGCGLALLVFIVGIGKLPRLARVTTLLVPSMIAGYMLMTLYVLVTHIEQIPRALSLIVHDAFTGNAMAGGVISSVIVTGIQRAAFSNEAGIGTEAMAHGAAKTKEPVTEGMVAMLGPIFDTLIVCTCTALVIIISGVWHDGRFDGISMTASAFKHLFPAGGSYLLIAIAAMLGLSTVFTFWYYGSKCLGFLIGAEHQHHYIWIYSVLVVLGAVASMQLVIHLVDSMYALMAIPTMLSALMLAPRVNQAARRYHSGLKTSALNS